MILTDNVNLTTNNNVESTSNNRNSQDNSIQNDKKGNEPAVPKVNVLLVDDDPMMLEMVKMILTDKARLAYATNGDQALEMVAREQFDIIYLDINLKHRINGIEVLNQLRKLPNYEYIPIVAFTAYAILGDEERFLQHGFSYYLPKPFTIEEFVKCIRLEYPQAGF